MHSGDGRSTSTSGARALELPASYRIPGTLLMWSTWLTAPFEPILRWFFGRDVFILYARVDAAAYAARLAIRLGERHSVYLDQYDLPRGARLPMRLQHALRRASTVAMVGSAGAVDSHWVPIEANEFLKTGRAVLLVDIDRALDRVDWSVPPWSELTGVYRQPESADHLTSGEPSDAVVTYVRESITYTRQDRRLRRATGAAVAFLVVVAAATSALVYQANRQMNAAQRAATEAKERADAAKLEEERARQEAARQEAVATSRRMAGESTAQLVRRPGLAMLLALQAWRDAPTIDARRALFAAVVQYPQLTRLQASPHAGGLDRVASAGGGARFATSDATGTTWLWDADTLTPSIQVSGLDPGAKETGFPLLKGTLGFSPDGRLLARTTMTGVAVWDIAKRRDIASITPDEAVMPRFAFVANARLAIPQGNNVEWWDVSEPDKPSKTASLSFGGEVAALAADASGKWLAVVGEKGLVFCESQSCEATRVTLQDSEIRPSEAVAVGGDAQRPLVASADVRGNVVLWDALSRKPLGSFTVTESSGDDDPADGALIFSPDGHRVAAIGFDGNIRVVYLDRALASGHPMFDIHKVPYGPGASTATFEPSGRHLITANLEGMMSFWDFDRGLPFEERVAFPAAPAEGRCGNNVYKAGEVHASADGAVLVAASGCEVIASVAPHSAVRVPMSTRHTGAIVATAVSLDGKWIASAGPVTEKRTDLTIVLWQAGQPRFEARISDEWPAGADGWLTFIDGASIPRVAFVQAGVPGNNEQLGRLAALWDPGDPAGAPHIVRRPGILSVMGMAVAPAARVIATREVGTPSNYLWQVESNTFEPLPSPKDYRGAKAITFSDDGRSLVAIGESPDGGMMKVTWDISTRPISVRATPIYSSAEQAALQLAGKSDMLRDAILGNSGRLLVEYRDGLYTVWDLEVKAFLYLVQDSRANFPPRIHWHRNTTAGRKDRRRDEARSQPCDARAARLQRRS